MHSLRQPKGFDKPPLSTLKSPTSISKPPQTQPKYQPSSSSPSRAQLSYFHRNSAPKRSQFRASFRQSTNLSGSWASSNERLLSQLIRLTRYIAGDRRKGDSKWEKLVSAKSYGFLPKSAVRMFSMQTIFAGDASECLTCWP